MATQWPDDALELLESTSNMLRGMTMDPSIPAHAKEAMQVRISEIERAVEEHLYEGD